MNPSPPPLPIACLMMLENIFKLIHVKVQIYVHVKFHKIIRRVNTKKGLRQKQLDKDDNIQK